MYNMVQRLHFAGFVQGSMNDRNILVQAGPLHLPPSKRSLSEPSFRIIDFGRGKYMKFEYGTHTELHWGALRGVDDVAKERRYAGELFGMRKLDVCSQP